MKVRFFDINNFVTLAHVAAQTFQTMLSVAGGFKRQFQSDPISLRNIENIAPKRSQTSIVW